MRGLSKMAVEKAVICPRNPRWLRSMLDVLPEGLRGKLEPYSECFSSPSSSVPPPSAGRPERRRNVIHPVIR